MIYMNIISNIILTVALLVLLIMCNCSHKRKRITQHDVQLENIYDVDSHLFLRKVVYEDQRVEFVFLDTSGNVRKDVKLGFDNNISKARPVLGISDVKDSVLHKALISFRKPKAFVNSTDICSITVLFIVEINGSISHPHLLSRSKKYYVCELFGKELVAKLKKYSWIPAKLDGNAVPVYMSLTFSNIGL